MATVGCQPPQRVIDNLGERAADHDRRAVWDAVVDRALRYRTDHDIPDEAPDLLGPQPRSSDVIQRVAWIAARRATESDLRRLTLTQVHRRSAIGR